MCKSLTFVSFTAWMRFWGRPLGPKPPISKLDPLGMSATAAADEGYTFIFFDFFASTASLRMPAAVKELPSVSEGFVLKNGMIILLGTDFITEELK
jgi:hypothetical protein